MNMKNWLKEEQKEHKSKVCSKKWVEEEKKEGHQSKIGSNQWWEEEIKEHSPNIKIEKYLPILKKPKFDFHECSICHYHYMESDMDLENGKWVCKKCEVLK